MPVKPKSKPVKVSSTQTQEVQTKPDQWGLDLDPIGGVFEEVGKLFFGTVFDGPKESPDVSEDVTDNDDDSTPETPTVKPDTTAEPKHERVTFKHIFTVAEPKSKRLVKPAAGASGTATPEEGEGEAAGE